jgi:hypothetical protein
MLNINLLLPQLKIHRNLLLLELSQLRFHAHISVSELLTLIFLIHCLLKNDPIIILMSIFINSIGSGIMQYPFVFTLESRCFLVSSATLLVKLGQLVLSGQVYFLLSVYFGLDLVVF